MTNPLLNRKRALLLAGKPVIHCSDRAKVEVKTETEGREWDGQALLNLVESFKCRKQDIHLFMVFPICFSEEMLGTEHAISGRQRLQNDVNLPTLD